MQSFSVLLALLGISMLGYSAYVIVQHGINIFPLFFGEIQALTWQGQFNYDFACYLLLSVIWIAWRQKFAPASFLLSLVGMILGMTFFAPYLLYLTFKEKGNIRNVLLGKHA